MGRSRHITVAIAFVGFVTAPKNAVTADQKQLQAKIAESKKLAEETRNNSENTTSSVDQAVLDKYELSKAQGNKAQKLELTAFGDSVMLDAATDSTRALSKSSGRWRCGATIIRQCTVY